MDWAGMKSSFGGRLQAAIDAAAFTVRRLYFRALRRWRTPGFRRSVLRAVGWTLFVTLYGMLVGATTALAPPMFSISLVALAFPFLLWTLPDLPSVPAKALRIAIYAAVVVEICIPDYYMVQISGLPWISARRLVVFVLILLTLYTFATSRSERAAVAGMLSERPILKLCVLGFLFMAFVSVPISNEPGFSASQFAELTLNWYLPFFSCLLVIRTDEHSATMYKMIAVLSLFVAALGVFDFIVEKNLALDVFPRSMLTSMLEANPSLQQMFLANVIRGGYYRASSIYHVPLSFGEFAAMVAPIGGFFILHGRTIGDRLFGSLVLTCAALDLFISGSRGGSVAFLVAMPMLAGLWIVRYTITHPRSMVGPMMVVLTFMGLVATGGVIFSWKRLHNIVLGGGDTVGSDLSRMEQFRLAWPHILQNPVTGHGLGRGGQIVGYVTSSGNLSIDSYVLSLLVETGVPGLLFFYGMIIGAAIIAIRIYLKDTDARAEVSGPLACSIVAYGVYRLVLSQHENQTLFFIFLALTFIVAQASARRLAAKKPTEFPVVPAFSGLPGDRDAKHETASGNWRYGQG